MRSLVVLMLMLMISGCAIWSGTSWSSVMSGAVSRSEAFTPDERERLLSELDVSTRERVINGHVSTGMTRSETLLALGKPYTIGDNTATWRVADSMAPRQRVVTYRVVTVVFNNDDVVVDLR